MKIVTTSRILIIYLLISLYYRLRDLNKEESSFKFLKGFFLFLSLSFLELDLALESSLETSPGLFVLFVLVVVGSESSSQVVQLPFVFLSHLSQGDCGGVFLVDKLSEGSFSLNEAVRNVHFFAESGEPDNEFEWFNIVSDGDKFGFSIFDEFGDVVETEFKVVGFVFGYIFF